MNYKEKYKEIYNMEKVDLLYLIENLMLDDKIDITDITICHTKALKKKMAEKDEIIHNADKASCNDYKKIIEHYGVRNQLKKLSEEVYELQEAVIEYGLMPCKENKGNVVEEMADVMVLLKQFADWFEITPEKIAEIMLNKVERTLERIKKEE